MTRDDVIRMAREATQMSEWSDRAVEVYGVRGGEAMFRFAALVAAAERKAICSIVHGLCISDNNAEEISRAIRARGRA